MQYLQYMQYLWAVSSIHTSMLRSHLLLLPSVSKEYLIVCS